MAEKNFSQPECDRPNLAITQFNRQNGNEIVLLDLDHAGANLETPFPLSPDYPVEFSFVLPGAPEEIQASGRVLWKQQQAVPSGRYQLRVQFYLPRWDLDRLLDRVA
jgi:predicted metalloenzyme YecM